MKKIQLTQEEIDRLSLFIENYINDESNPVTQDKVVDVFNELPDTADSKMEKQTQ